MATMAITSTRYGIVRVKSTRRMISESSQPPEYPATSPRIPPTTTVPAVAIERHDEVDPPAIGEPGEDVAPEVVGAQEMVALGGASGGWVKFGVVGSCGLTNG